MLSLMKPYVPYNPILYIIPCIIPYLSNDNIYIYIMISRKNSVSETIESDQRHRAAS